MALTLKRGSRIHFSGIGGSSMSGLARLMLWRGYRVTGSDRDGSHTVDKLIAEGIPTVVGHRAENVEGADLMVYTSALAPDNPELIACREKGIPTMERQVFLGEISSEYEKSVAICGTHGKTTTTSMLAQALIDAKADPTVHIGGELLSIGSNVRTGSHELFVTEADEFRANFLHLKPTLALFLNIDEDHMEFYRDIGHIIDTFRTFQDRIQPGGVAVLCGDDKNTLGLLKDAPCRCVTYGLDGDWDYSAKELSHDSEGRYAFTAYRNGHELGRISLRVVGIHNARNALGALASACELGIDPEAVIRSLNAFSGVHRRFELTGEVQGVRLYHDYGHNPAEYRTVVPIAAMLPHRRLYVVLQPHTYSRVKRLFDQFITAFDGADEVLVTDIYAAREKDPGDIHSTMLIDAMHKAGVPAVYTPTFEDCKKYLHENWQPGDIVLTVGCGNINLLNEML